MSGPTQVAELKQQGAIEAAQATGTQEAADAAAKKVVDESKKSGIAAYEFDPNASPEEKAQQAKNALPEGLTKKTNAIAVATDIDDGKPPAYDLPPPSTAGVIRVPTTGEGERSAQLASDEEDIARKVGWAPRFGYGTGSKDVDNETAQDSSTWLEEKIPENLFGGKFLTYRIDYTDVYRMVAQCWNYGLCLSLNLGHHHPWRWPCVSFHHSRNLLHIL